MHRITATLAVVAWCCLSAAGAAPAAARGEKAPVWRYTFGKPAAGWFKADFDDSAWRRGPGGFGAGNTPSATARTEWSTPDIWIRREFEIAGEVPGKPGLRIYHDEDAEVYVNGVPAAKVLGHTVAYYVVPMTPPGAAALKTGTNVIAVHCRQTRGGQYIDVGIAGLAAPPKPK